MSCCPEEYPEGHTSRPQPLEPITQGSLWRNAAKAPHHLLDHTPKEPRQGQGRIRQRDDSLLLPRLHSGDSWRLRRKCRGGLRQSFHLAADGYVLCQDSRLISGADGSAAKVPCQCDISKYLFASGAATGQHGADEGGTDSRRYFSITITSSMVVPVWSRRKLTEAERLTMRLT